MNIKKKYLWRELKKDPPFDDNFYFPVVQGQKVKLLPEKKREGLEQIYTDSMDTKDVGRSFKVVECHYEGHPTRLLIHSVAPPRKEWVVNPWNIIPVENIIDSFAELPIEEIKTLVYD